jgi:hypothetical protein
MKQLVKTVIAIKIITALIASLRISLLP